MPIKFYKTMGTPEKTFAGSEEVHFTDKGYIYVSDNNGNQMPMYTNLIDSIVLTEGKKLAYTKVDGTKGSITLDVYTTSQSDNRYITQANPTINGDQIYHEGNLPPGLLTPEEKTKLKYIENLAEVNQNAYTKIKVNNQYVNSKAKEDTLELIAGNNITITPDVTDRKITISAQFSSSLIGPLDNLQDVVISNPSNGDILRYDSMTETWKNGPQASREIYLLSPSGQPWAVRIEDDGQLFVEASTLEEAKIIDTVVGEDTIASNDTTVGKTKK